MFSVIFPGQGSQMVGMGKEFYDKFDLVKNLFKEADETLSYPISKLILNGPQDKLDLTTNTQPAIFLISYSIFKVIKNEFNINLNEAKYYAGHSLGEYSALSCAGYLDFSDTIKILKTRGDAMQNAVPKGEGGMIAVLGSKIEIIEKILLTYEDKFKVQIANDNSESQIVLSGKIDDLNNLILILKQNSIKNVKLPVSAPFHCSLMSSATKIMAKELDKLNFKDTQSKLISNVTAKIVSNSNELKELLIKQIENRVRWRESVLNMIKSDVNHFIEIGPGKVLSGLLKRISKNIKIDTINTLEDIKNLKI
ncbi:ACP S-malonyltransferase [Candidatus Pelagibacter sp.]|nr:ACP S-malonyltransferase [Candidatus Pelagibacter sp.]